MPTIKGGFSTRNKEQMEQIMKSVFKELKTKEEDDEEKPVEQVVKPVKKTKRVYIRRKKRK